MKRPLAVFAVLSVLAVLAGCKTVTDPFLIANIDGIDYYVAVWDEDDFLV